MAVSSGSADAGMTWRPISRALPNDSIRGIVSSDRTLVVATGNGIFKTVDQGKQWTPVNKGLTNQAIQVLIGSRKRQDSMPEQVPECFGATTGVHGLP